MKFNNRNIFISPLAKIGTNVKIGDNTIIYDNVEIGENTIIANDCVIGEPLNNYYYSKDYQNPVTKIGRNSLIRSHAIIYASADLGEGFSSGHRITIRENTKFGKEGKVGTLCDIQGYVTFGEYCWLHSNVHIGQRSTIGNFVFIFPYVVFTNDPHPPSEICIGPTISDYAQIAVGAILLPDVKIGTHTLIGANSVVINNVNDFDVVAGSPAKRLCDIRDIKSKINPEKSYYPWPYNFDRGMPWEGKSYDEWLNEKS